MSEPSSGALRHALAEMSEEMPAARLPEDLWRRGKRRHRRRASAGIAASVLAVVLAVPLVGAVLERSPQQALGVGPDGAVPARLYIPWMGLGTVQQSPQGRAALLVSGGGQLASAPDLPGTYGSRIAVVGRDGSYRMLRYGGMYKQAGQDVLLSPDGRYVAGDATLEHLNPPARSSEVTVVDLMTGQVRRYRDLPAGQPVGWSPDGSQLLLFQEPECPDDSVPAASGTTSNISRCELGSGALWLLDRASGRLRQFLDLSGVPVHRATFVAFAPDGRHLAVQVAQRLIVVDTVDGTSRTLAELGPRTRLAGAGAWSRDGASISVFTVDGCTSPCEWT
ncbi:MAG TPA: hypothetical protein VHN18_01870, partial [Micromonosporaceae bacterium]|nr:hypothetical protein [Micromonosporaceae bacterium]